MNSVNKQKICLAFDVSGSLFGMFNSLKNIREFDRIIQSINKKYNNPEIHIVTFDTKITHTHVLKDHETIYDLKMETISGLGGGGTCPNCVFEYMDKNECKDLHVITDGYMAVDKSNIEGDIFAYLTGKHSTTLDNSWNKVIQFDEAPFHSNNILNEIIPTNQ